MIDLLAIIKRKVDRWKVIVIDTLAIEPRERAKSLESLHSLRFRNFTFPKESLSRKKFSKSRFATAAAPRRLFIARSREDFFIFPEGGPLFRQGADFLRMKYRAAASWKQDGWSGESSPIRSPHPRISRPACVQRVVAVSSYELRHFPQRERRRTLSRCCPRFPWRTLWLPHAVSTSSPE